MSFYFTSQLKAIPGAVAAWSQDPTTRPLYALSLPRNVVGIYREDGSLLVEGKDVLIKNIRGSVAVQLAWHPTLMLLAIGWKDGAISFWNKDECKLNEDSKVHRCALSVLSWSLCGSLLATADGKGRVSLWQYDQKLRPISIATHDESGCIIGCHIWGNSSCSREKESPTPCFYYAVSSDTKQCIVRLNCNGGRKEILSTNVTIYCLINYAEKQQLILITSNCILMAYERDENEEYRQIAKMKFATGSGEDPSSLKATWSSPHTLASCSEKDSAVRMYNFETEDNYTLALDNCLQDQGFISCLSYNNCHGILTVGTTEGKVCLFRYMGEPLVPTEIKREIDRSCYWDTMGMCMISEAPTRIDMGPLPKFLHVYTANGITLCRRGSVQARLRDKVSAIQVGPEDILITNIGNYKSNLVTTRLRVVGLDVSNEHLLVWDGEQVEVYSLNSSEYQMISQFAATSSVLGLHSDSVYRLADHVLEVCNLTGIVKQTIPFDPADGVPTHIDVNGDFLAVLTNLEHIHVFKLGGREARACCSTQILHCNDQFKPLGPVSSIRLNCNGAKISILKLKPDNQSMDTCLHIHDVEHNRTFQYDFSPQYRCPDEHCWDDSEPNLLAVQVVQLSSRSNFAGNKHERKNCCMEVVTLFATEDQGALLENTQQLKTGTVLAGLSSPDLIVFQEINSEDSKNHHVKGITMRCFEGIMGIDAMTKSALLNFGLQLAVGNVDEAVKSIQSIHNSQIWESMAQMCIKHKRIAVAELCMSNMEHYKGSKTLRESKGLAPDVRVAKVAVHLDMVADARAILKDAHHYDKLIVLLQATGMWDRAIAVAEKHDRLHLKTTHFERGRHYEKLGDYRSAVQEFEKSGCGSQEIPRMMVKAGKARELSEYIQQSGNPDLLLWWGRYCESRGDFVAAVKFYKQAENTLAVAKALCFQGQLDEAHKLVQETKHPAAAFFLGQQYEAQDMIPEAIRCFTMAEKPHHGVRLARQFEMDSELLRLALLTQRKTMLDTAEYFYEKQDWESAMMLYSKGGNQKKALEICLEANLVASLETILYEVDSDGDLHLLLDAAEVLLQHRDFDTATKLLLKANQSDKALAMCIQHDIPINEAMAEAMTPDKSSASTIDRNAALLKIAKVCKKQGLYHISAKKYAEAGQRTKAIKALIKTGDTDKVIKFANRSREKDVYILAGNFLQTVDWQRQPDVANMIERFYTKANAHESLVAFSLVHAQAEIDEHRNYETGLRIMEQALHCAESCNPADNGARIAAIRKSLEFLRSFAHAQRIMQEDPEEAISSCELLAKRMKKNQQADEVGLRLGDVYALMVEFWFSKEDMGKCFELVQDMSSSRVNLAAYIDKRTLQTIHKAANQELGLQTPAEDDIGEENMNSSNSDETD